LSLLGDYSPNERHQYFAPFFGSAAPVRFFQSGSFFTLPFFLFISDSSAPVENFLPAKSVGHDENDVLGLIASGEVGRERLLRVRSTAESRRI